MSTKHFFPSTEGVVLLGLEALVTRNRHLALDAPNKVVYDRTHSPSKIAIISGGGSGHEPAWSGYVGQGMLTAAVSGEVFASPSTKQIMAAIRHVPSDIGLILCITNYTGDNLHFGLAKEKALGLGHNVAILRMTDDVALGRKQTENLGRRGLAGNMFVLKLCGGASEAGFPFEQCHRIGQAVNDNCVTVGSSLDHCHIPGREHHRAVPQSAYVLGMGIHNEPGLHEVDPMPSVESLVSDMLRYCLDPTDKDRAFVPFDKDDVVLLLINDFGGMSAFELSALTTVTRRMLKQDWGIEPQREFAQCFESSLNAPGWSLSLLNVTGIGRETGMPVSDLLALVDSPTTAPAWPKNGYAPVDVIDQSTDTTEVQLGARSDGPLLSSWLPSAIHAGATNCIEHEPELTKWDIQMGDGDCGEAVVNMCQGATRKLDAALGRQDNHLFNILDDIVDAVEDVGGSFAAIMSIMLASFSTSLRKAQLDQIDAAAVSKAAGAALKSLMGYTSARVGGRTVMDALIPFCETFESTGDFSEAAKAAASGAQSTGGMKAKFGRATYVGDTQAIASEAPPDPGAYAVVYFLQGFLQDYGSDRNLTRFDSRQA